MLTAVISVDGVIGHFHFFFGIIYSFFFLLQISSLNVYYFKEKKIP